MSSNACDIVRHVLGAEHAALIDYDACGASLFGKRRHLLRVLKESGVRPGQAIVIAHERRDLEVARAEGIPFGAVAWGDARREALEAQAPAAVFADPAGVVEQVAGRPPSDV